MGGNEALLLDPLIGGRKNNGGGRKGTPTAMASSPVCVEKSNNKRNENCPRAIPTWRRAEHKKKKNFNRERMGAGSVASGTCMNKKKKENDRRSLDCQDDERDCRSGIPVFNRNDCW